VYKQIPTNSQLVFFQVTELELVLRRGLGWDYRVSVLGGGGVHGGASDEEEDEDGPVVVELPEEVQQQLNL
jgi:hypothetical protein